MKRKGLRRQLNFNGAAAAAAGAIMANGGADVNPGTYGAVNPYRSNSGGNNGASASSNLQLAILARLLTQVDWPLPDAVKVAVASATGAGAAEIRVYLFNQDELLNVTNNGSGAASVTYSYTDVQTSTGSTATTGGNIVSRILRYAMGGLGAMVFGVVIRVNITSSGAGDPTGLGATNPYYVRYDSFGTSKPSNIAITMNQTRGDFDTSIEVTPGSVFLNAITQFSLRIPVGDTITVTQYHRPDFKK